MTDHRFAYWLKREIYSVKLALLTLFERQDALDKIRRPQLEREYMEKIGNYEQSVIMEEIECDLLLKKKQMVQSAINRREPIDEDAIDAELGLLREQMIEEACETGDGFKPYGDDDIPPEKFDELQDLYRRITESFHPQLHPELTEIQRELFKKATDAYRRHDLDALRLIHDMLFGGEGSALEITLEIGVSDGSDGEEDPYATTDYTLAAIVYEQFEQTGEEAVIGEDLEQLRQKFKATEASIQQMKLEFPFTAEEMLSDPAQVEEYKAELEIRMKNAKNTRVRREEEIRNMIRDAKQR